MKLIILFCGKRIDCYNFESFRQHKLVICAVMNCHFYNAVSAASLAGCDEVIKIDQVSSLGYLFESDFAETIAKLNDIVLKYQAQQIEIVCTYEGDVGLACRVREYFALPGMTYQDSLLFRDKDKTKEFLQGRGIKVPRFMKIDLHDLVDDLAYYNAVCDYLGRPFIIKPTSSGGGYGVYKISTRADLLKLKNILLTSNLVYEAEEFIVGNLYHIDLILQNGKVAFAECCIYNHQYFGFEKHSIVGSTALADSSSEKAALIKFCNQVVTQLGAFNGSYHCEVFKDAKQITFLEIAARPAGALIFQMYQMMYGINLFDLDFAAQANLAFASKIKRSYYGVWACFVSYESNQFNLKEQLEAPSIAAKSITWYPNPILVSNDGEVSVVGHLLYRHRKHKIMQQINTQMAELGIPTSE